MDIAVMDNKLCDVQAREAAATIRVYGQPPFLAERAEGCEIITADGRRVLDLYGGHAVAGLGYAHPFLTRAIEQQAKRLLFQSNAVAREVRAEAAEELAHALKCIGHCPFLPGSTYESL